MPALAKRRAKLFSAAPPSRGFPSRRSWLPDTASSRLACSSLGPRAVCNSLQAVSYCVVVRGWPKSYILANLSRMLRLRTKARAAVIRTFAWSSTNPADVYRDVFSIGTAPSAGNSTGVHLYVPYDVRVTEHRGSNSQVFPKRNALPEDGATEPRP